MEKRTNTLYTVTVCKYASMAVEAGSPQQAMDIAKRNKDEYLTERDFEDSEMDVYGCDAYACSIDDMCLESNEKVFTIDGVVTAGQYKKLVSDED